MIVAPREVSVGLGRRGVHTFFPGSHKWKCQCIVPTNGWDHSSMGPVLALILTQEVIHASSRYATYFFVVQLGECLAIFVSQASSTWGCFQPDTFSLKNQKTLMKTKAQVDLDWIPVPHAFFWFPIWLFYSDCYVISVFSIWSPIRNSTQLEFSSVLLN